MEKLECPEVAPIYNQVAQFIAPCGITEDASRILGRFVVETAEFEYDGGYVKTINVYRTDQESSKKVWKINLIYDDDHRLVNIEFVSQVNTEKSYSLVFTYESLDGARNAFSKLKSTSSTNCAKNGLQLFANAVMRSSCP